MKTIESVKKQINQIFEKRGELTTKEEKTARKDLEFLNGVLLYLQSKPSEEFVKKQRQDIQRSLLRSSDKIFRGDKPHWKTLTLHGQPGIKPISQLKT